MPLVGGRMSLGVGARADEEAVGALTFLPFAVVLVPVFVLVVLEVVVFVELLLPLGTGKLAPFSE